MFKHRSTRDSKVFRRKKFHKLRRYREMLYSASTTMGLLGLLALFLFILGFHAIRMVQVRFATVSAVKYMLPAAIFATAVFFSFRVRAAYREVQAIREEMRAWARNEGSDDPVAPDGSPASNGS
jgi:hypothetical protein